MLRPALIAALFVVEAGAALAADISFRTPSGNIGCIYEATDGGRLICLRYEPSVLSVILTPDGVDFGPPETWDSNMAGKGVTILAYGASRKLGPFTCVSRKSGLSCRGENRGFTINRSGVTTQ